MKKGLLIVMLMGIVAGATACGQSGSTRSSTNADPSQPPAGQPTATPTPAIYVAALSGDDANDGARTRPMRSIHAALLAAQSLGIADVYLYGGDEGAFAEVVDLPDGINLHGDLCFGSGSLSPDPDQCPTVISGGSPTFVADGIRNTATLVENVQLVGAPAVQNQQSNGDSFFEVPGVGCVGRGNAPARFKSCTPPSDDQGRPLPVSAIGAVVHDSSMLTFRNVTVKSGNAADGLPGEDGARGEEGTAGVPATVTGSEAWHAGFGGAAGVNAACPEANGGNGGKGGRWYWDGVTAFVANGKIFPTLDTNTVYPGESGTAAAAASANAGAGGMGAASNPALQRGGNGANGVDGVAGTPVADGLSGDVHIDPATLVAGNGGLGPRGHAGVGGGGAGGGAPASIELYSKDTQTSKSGINAFGVGGTQTVSGATTIDHNVGETAGGAGGGGGAAGCGGYGGTGGQGGAASVALYVVDSQLAILDSTVNAGNGGNGGHGGLGGDGGAGKQGGDGSYGALTQKYAVEGTFNASGTWNATSFDVTGSSSESTMIRNSASQGGNGGRGGFGGAGSRGGNGGAGAGGASIAILRVGSTAAVSVSGGSVNAGTPGNGGDMAEATTGLAAADYSI